MVMPRGRRNSEPTPVPSARGKPPRSAAMVVIMIGRKRSLQASRHIQFLLHAVDGVDGVAQGCARREVEGNGDDGKLALMVQRERGAGRVEARKGAERDLRAVGGLDVNIL